MRRSDITAEDVDALLRFLPLFERPGRSFARWTGGGANGDGSISLPFPVYEADVEEFFRRVAQRGFLDYGYRPSEAADMLADPALVEAADLNQIKSMLTLCLRSERFGDGNWEAYLKGGQVVALLRRLRIIRERM